MYIICGKYSRPLIPSEHSWAMWRCHLLCFHFVSCEKEVSNLINHPVVRLLVTRVGGTSVEVVPKRIGLNHKTRLGSSASCDSKFPLLVIPSSPSRYTIPSPLQLRLCVVAHASVAVNTTSDRKDLFDNLNKLRSPFKVFLLGIDKARAKDKTYL